MIHTPCRPHRPSNSRPGTSLAAAALGIALFGAPLAAQPAVSFAGENMAARSASVTAAGGGAWNVGLVCEDDNADSGLPNSFRRWWHCEVANLGASGEVLHFRITNAGYSDVILPCWAMSFDGGTSFNAYTRAPGSAVPSVTGGGSTHSFTLLTPPGVTNIRVAKFFPYSVTQKNALLASINGHPSGRVRAIRNLGTSWQGRTLEVVDFTDPAVPDTNKRRIWIHSGIHPAETTSYFVVEGLFDFLLSAHPDAALLLSNAIVHVVPMCNPDGVFLGNYRTNSRSSNLEEQWRSPYNSPEREIIALRTEIQRLMGTPSAPASNPIEVVLNLHSTHGGGFPYHFRHTANPNFDLVTNRTGVIPAVNALETQWIQAFKGQSPFVDLGSTGTSSCGAPNRPFVECMMHDRWTIDSAWTSNGQRPVMSITFEGTYGRGPDTVSWSTIDDYRDVGAALGRSLVDYFGFTPPAMTASLTVFGTPCNGLLFGGSIVHTAPSTNVANLTVLSANPGAQGMIMLGASRTMLPLPPPWNCPILDFIGSAPLAVGPGPTRLSVPIPPVPGLSATLQILTGVVSGPNINVQTSVGIEIRNNF